MKKRIPEGELTTKLFFRLLPIQILLALVHAVNGTISGLCLEEMAGNVVLHGFHKDRKRHSVDIRVVYKEGEIILRIKDDCKPFDPSEQIKVFDPNDKVKNVGIRLVHGISKQLEYRNMLGLNVLMVRI